MKNLFLNTDLSPFCQEQYSLLIGQGVTLNERVIGAVFRL